jgi:uncharacterized C2H2 Zn-finger protein
MLALIHDLSSRESDGSLPCPECGRIFGSRVGLVRHRESAHPARPSTPRCEVCRMNSETPEDLAAHYVGVHGVTRSRS